MVTSAAAVSPDLRCLGGKMAAKYMSEKMPARCGALTFGHVAHVEFHTGSGERMAG